MATTNLLQWNPTAVNQENDAQYNADSQRAGGATNPSVFQAELANKAFFQWSTYLTALFQAFANKGFTTSDSNLNTLTAQCANFLTTKDVLPPQINVPFASSMVFNGALAASFRVDLTGNVTSSNFINMPPAGAMVVFYIVSASPGNFSFSWPPQVQNARNVQTESQNNLFTEQFISDGGSLWPLSTFMNILSSQVTNAQNTANTAITNAANAQNTANTAVGLANTAQGTANAAASAASAAQGTANTALGTANNAQASANSAQGTANTAISQIAALHTNGSRSNVTGGRAFGVTYTNSTGTLLLVTGSAQTAGSQVGSVAVYIDGAMDYAMTTGATVISGAIGFSFSVPAGSTYRMDANTFTGGRPGVIGLYSWFETAVVVQH